MDGAQLQEKRAQTAAVGRKAAGVWVGRSLREHDVSSNPGDSSPLYSPTNVWRDSSAREDLSSSHAARTLSMVTPMQHRALASSPSGSMSQSSAGELKLTSAKLSTMHWGEREVEAWHRREEQRLSYRSDLLAQVGYSWYVPCCLTRSEAIMSTVNEVNLTNWLPNTILQLFHIQIEAKKSAVKPKPCSANSGDAETSTSAVDTRACGLVFSSQQHLGDQSELSAFPDAKQGPYDSEERAVPVDRCADLGLEAGEVQQLFASAGGECNGNDDNTASYAPSEYDMPLTEPGTYI